MPVITSKLQIIGVMTPAVSLPVSDKSIFNKRHSCCAEGRFM